MSESVDGALPSQDFDGDGYRELLLVDQNHDGYNETLLRDEDGDGVTETTQVDTDLDGRADVAYVDPNHDGVADQVNVDANRDGVLDQASILSQLAAAGAPVTPAADSSGPDTSSQDLIQWLNDPEVQNNPELTALIKRMSMFDINSASLFIDGM